MDEPVFIIDGGVVECIEGLRIWARTEDGREVLILVQGRHHG
jgi:hypothetical protein